MVYLLWRSWQIFIESEGSKLFFQRFQSKIALKIASLGYANEAQSQLCLSLVVILRMEVSTLPNSDLKQHTVVK